LKAKLSRIKDKQNLIKFAGALCMSVILFLIFFSLLFIMLSFSNFNNTQQFIITLGIKIGLILLVIYIFLQTQKNCDSEYHVAKQIDQITDPESDTVQNALDFICKETQGLNIIKQRYCQNAENLLNQTKYPYNFSYLKIWSVPLLSLLIGLSFLAFFKTDDFLKTWHLFKAKNIIPENYQTRIDIKPGSVQISRNSNLLIEIVNPEKNVNYSFWSSQGEKWKQESLINPHKQLFNIEQSFKYFIKSQYGSSDTFFVKIIDEPVVKKLNIKISYPAYTKLKAEYRGNTDGNISVLQGSILSLDIETDENIKNSEIVLSDKNFYPLKKLGKQNWGCNLNIKNSIGYHFSLTNNLGVKSQPLERNITMIPDKAPEIQFVYPARDTILPQTMKYTVSFQASDDFGLKNIKLHYLANNEYKKEILLKKQTDETLYETSYTLDFNDIFLLPGDKIIYWAEAEDNSPASQKVVSKKYTLRFPSMEEVFEENAEKEKENKDNLSKALQETKKLQEEFEKKRREMMRKDQSDNDDKREIQQMLKKQENISDLVDNVSNEYQKNDRQSRKKSGCQQ
jgi:hypothetical protein